MAVTITQQPTTPNAAYTRLPYVVSGSVTTSNPQYQYVMDIYESGSSDLITRITQTKNPQGVAVFDPSKVFQGELQQDDFWKIGGASGSINSLKTFEVKFGEQYGTSVSSSITVYPDLVSTEIQVFPGVVDPNNGVSYNFNTSSFAGAGNSFLTNAPAAQTTNGTPNNEYVYLVNSNDYMTLTAFQDNVATPGYILLNAVKVVNGVSGGTVLQDALTFPSANAKFTTLGVGPQNMADYLPAWKTAIDNGDINLIYSTNDPGGFAIYINDLWDGVPATAGNGRVSGLKDPIKQCSDDYTRFAFINSYGFWDYYNIYNPVRRQSDIGRQSVTLPQLDYSSISSPYNVNNRGQKNYYTEVEDRFEIDTEYLDKNMANWLEELLNSPSVYVQKGRCFVPVIITNSQYQHNNSTSRNKSFQYTITFEPANQPYGDWDQIPSQCEEGVVPGPPVPEVVYTIYRIRRIDDGETSYEYDGKSVAYFQSTQCLACSGGGQSWLNSAARIPMQVGDQLYNYQADPGDPLVPSTFTGVMGSSSTFTTFGGWYCTDNKITIPYIYEISNGIVTNVTTQLTPCP